jgi:hypothetical protein
MSSVSNQRSEPTLLVDVELVPIGSTESLLESSRSTEEKPLQQNRTHMNGPVKSYQSTAPTKSRTISSASDDSNLLPDIGYSPISSKFVLLEVPYVHEK